MHCFDSLIIIYVFRSFQQETARMDESEDQAASQSAESVLKSIDSKTVASILRGLADAGVKLKGEKFRHFSN